MPSWIPGSKENQKKNDALFFEALKDDFLNFIFLKFCKMEELKEFVKKYVLGKASEEKTSKFAEEKRPDVPLASEPKQTSWAEKWGAVFNKFMDSVDQAANKAIQGATQVVHKVLPTQLHTQGKQIVGNMFQPAQAVPHVQQVLNGFQPKQLNMVQQFKQQCPVHLRPIFDARLEKLQGAIEKFQRGGAQGDLQGVLHQAMRMSMLMRHMQDTAKFSNVSEKDRRQLQDLYPHLREHQKTYAGSFAAAGAQMVTATRSLGQNYNQSLSVPAFNPSPLSTTPDPFNRR